MWIPYHPFVMQIGNFDTGDKDMLLRIPTYYRAFQCLAGKCKNSCCVGWEIDIDEDTYDYYCQVPGQFGERLRSHMKAGKENSFRLHNRRCPFLNDANLCDICTELGEEALSEVCTEYPRFTMEYGETIEKCMSLSCEEVGRLIFETQGAIEYEEMRCEDTYLYEDEAKEDEEVRIHVLEETRKTLFSIIQTRTLSMEERMGVCLIFGERIQDLMNEEKYEEAEHIAKEYCIEDGIDEVRQILNHSEHALKLCEFRNQCFEELELLDHEWKDAFEEMKDVFSREHHSETEYRQWIRQFMNRDREREYEHLFSYFIFRYFMRAVYDYNLLNKVKFSIIAVLCIRDLDVIRSRKSGGRFGVEEQIDIARIFSKQVEHSEENVENLMEMLEFETEFKTRNLISSMFLS